MTGNATAAGVRRVALVGRANAGKTSLLMHLTGSLQRPVNFPGSSVECVESRVVVDGLELVVTDLPGIASLQATSRDEQLALDVVHGRTGEHQDVLCVVVDASRLPVELAFLHSLRRLGLQLVVALTKVDVAAAEGFPIDAARLQQALGLPLVVVHGVRGAGVDELRRLLATVPTDVVPAAPGDAALAPGAAPILPARTVRSSRTDRLDRVLLHPFTGPVVLLLVVLVMFQLVFAVAEPFIGWIEDGQGLVSAFVGGFLPDGAVRSFVVDGVINGVGSSLVFVPQIALLIAFVTIVEATGYMARAVFLLDRLLRGFGLSGKSFVPLASSFACAIPGILASRILGDERDRLATIAVAPLMSCSARMPVYVVLLAAFFPPAQAGLLLFLLYLLGIVVAVLVALVLRKTALRGGDSMLLLELPAYQRPRFRLVLAHTWFAVKGFLRTAGSVILVATMVVWALGYFPRPAAIHERFEGLRAAAPAGEAGLAQRAQLDADEAAAYLEQSWLAGLGKTVQPVFAPAGFDWRMTVGVLAAFPARELVVPTLGTLYSLGEVEASADEPDVRLTEALRTAKGPDGRPTLDWLTALAVMVFVALCSQCVGTLAAIRRETNSWRWPLFTFGYMTALAWLGAVAVQQIGRALGYGA
ncbi:MAG: ferrous iron transporter B [Planctomycetes bacterium]|nr:ferrous iron transporter B [Planctomycetota bacterium]